MTNTLVLCEPKVEWDGVLWSQSAGHDEGGEACEEQSVSDPSPGLHKLQFKWDVTAPI